MRLVNLEKLPRQSFSLSDSGTVYDVRIFLSGDTMLADVDINKERVISGVRVIAGIPVIPFKSRQVGNFAFLTLNNSDPFWDRFGVDQALFFVGPSELA